MNNFYLIRHGQKIKEKGDPGLTDFGKKQSEKTGEYLKNKNIVVVYCSPFLRTKQTAQEINKFLGVKIISDDRLKERANWGDVENQPFEEFLKEWYQASQKRHVRVHGRPSSFQKGEEVKSLILELNEKYKEKNIVLVTHGGAIGDFVRNEFGDKKIKELTGNEGYKIDEYIKECSVTEIILKNNNSKLKKFANMFHLKESE